MKAIVQTGPEEVEVQDIEKPTPASDEVLISVENAGVCGSDVHAYHIMDGFEFVKIPRVMGHEYAGTVVETGEDVSNFEIGDTVVEAPIHPCGECYQCEIGEENVCQHTTLTGMETDGAFANFTTVNEEFLLDIPDGIPLRHAALTEPLSIATRAVYDRSNVTPGDPVVVQGPGPIGALSAVILDSMGADVIVSGLGKDGKYRLPLLEEMGIKVVNIQDNSLEEKVAELTNGIGVEAVFDTTGHKSGVESAVELVRKGGEIVVVGIASDPSELFFSPIVRGEIKIDTSYGSSMANFNQALRVLKTGEIDFDALIDQEYEMNEPAKAFDDFLDAKTLKPMFSF